MDYEYETVDTTFFLGTIYWLETNETYYWRVRTRSINKEDTYSKIYSFRGAFFQVISPAAGDTVSLTPTFVCDSISLPTEYTFEVATSQTFSGDDLLYTATASVPRITMPDSILVASKNYFVRATAKFADLVTTSDAVRFRTVALDVPVPVIISPAMGEVIKSNSVTVKWQNQVSSGYQVELCKSASFPSRSIKKSHTDLYTHECTYDNIEEGTWYVRVAAMKEGGLTDYSEVVSFMVEIPSAVDDIHMSNLPTKIIENGQVYILRNGVRYDLLGRTAQ